jgi:hypothetical protein
MAKKPAPAKKPTAECTKQLVEAIVTVKSLQDFLADNGGVEKAVEAVARVQKLIELTGGFEQLNTALKIVGGEPAGPAAVEA